MEGIKKTVYELIRVTERFYFVDCPAKIGIYKITENEIALIDSGNNKGAATKVLRIAEQNGWQIRMILNTHAHADHTGGNRHVQAKTGCKIYAPIGELDGVRHPLWEPISLFGAKPPRALCHGFLLADESEAEPLTEAVMPEGLSIFPLAGHTPDMVGFATEDGAVYLADALASEQTLEKYGIPFVYDVGVYLETLGRIEKMQGKIFVPAHAAPTEDIRSLAEKNRQSTEALIGAILENASAPIGFEPLLSLLFSQYGLVMSIEQYALVGSTLRSYLSYLCDTGRMEHVILENALCFVRKE